MKLPEGYVNGVAPVKATAMGGFGQTMLERLGWQKGEGLGKHKQGRDAPIHVTRKDDNAGLGGKRGWDSQQDFAVQAYETAMANVSAQLDADHSSSDSSDEESDVFAAIVQDTSATAEELKLSRKLAKGNQLGRFGARAGKLRRVQEQEAAVLAGLPTAEPPAPAADCSSAAATKSLKVKGTQPEATTAAPRIIVIGAEDQDAAPLPPPAPQASSWWGNQMFASSGWLAGLRDLKQKEATRDSFTHETQEAIYKNAMSKKVQGKTGMGKTRGRDAAADWKGKKTTFDAEADPAGALPAQVQGGGMDTNSSAAEEGSIRKQSAAFLKTARKLLRQSKKGRLKRRRLEASLSEALELPQEVIHKRLQKRIDSNKLVQTQQWITINCATC